MKTSIKYILLFLIMPYLVYAQDGKPKVALVLSGGGAKGIAHIPMLQTLDSLGIVPDLIVGNSMGSIVGGLYAMGYSGDSIATIAKSVEWDKMIGGGVELSRVGVEEKTEFRRYFIKGHMKDGKVKSSPFLLRDQNLRDFLSTLTIPVYNISDFDQLPIPYRAVATDIVHGKEVILDSGSLATAMRASMSIPIIFTPVDFENTMLIDGGVLNNFPTNIAKDLKADIIIGSTVGFGMRGKEDLETIPALLIQTAMLNSKVNDTQSKALCDILLDHTVNLSYTTADFSKTDKIYEEGKIAVTENIEALVGLAQELKRYKQRKPELPKVENEIILDTIVYEDISPANINLTKARIDISPNRKYKKEDFFDGINRAMGTNVFSQIMYSSLSSKNNVGLKLKFFEVPQHQLHGSLHYDTYRNIGLIVNYTGRNIIGSASRSLITLDLADQPRVRLQHQKNFSHDRDWWWRSEFFGQRVNKKVFIDGETADNFRSTAMVYENQINRNLNSLKSYIGFSVLYRNNLIKPTVSPELNDNIFDLLRYKFSNVDLKLHFSHNTLNDVFFATKGSSLRIELSGSLTNSIDIEFLDNSPESQDGSTNDFSRFGLNYESRIGLSSDRTFKVGLQTNLIFEDRLKEGEVSFGDFGISEKYALGGNVPGPRNESVIFPGLNRGELIVNQIVKVNLGLQFALTNDIYLTPHMDAAMVGFGNFEDYAKQFFNSISKWSDSSRTSSIWSAGMTFSYKSILGPLNFDLSHVSGTNKLRFFIGLGYPLSPSN